MFAVLLLEHYLEVLKANILVTQNGEIENRLCTKVQMKTLKNFKLIPRISMV